MSKAKTVSRRAAPAYEVPEPVVIPADVDRTPASLLQLACKLSLTSGQFIDTKFYAYSRRKISGEVYAPQPIYASSYLLRARAPEYFEGLLVGGFKGRCIAAPLNGPLPVEFPPETSGYESDSDIEDDDELDSPLASAQTIPSSSALPATPGASAEGKQEDRADDSEDAEAAALPGNIGQVCLMSNFAYPTWKAFVFYLYTGQIAFAPLKSQGNPSTGSSNLKPSRKDNYTPSPPLCSPKSMYRLADELGLNDLKALAKNAIGSKLSEQNIVTELLSTLTARDQEIRDMEVGYAVSTGRQAVKRGISEWMNTMSAEELKQKADIVAYIIQKF